MSEPGIPFVYQGHAYRLRALKLDVESGGLPRWIRFLPLRVGTARGIEQGGT